MEEEKGKVKHVKQSGHINLNDYWNTEGHRLKCPKCGSVWWHIGWGGRHCLGCGHHRSAPMGL